MEIVLYREIELMERQNGKSPAAEFIRTLDQKTKNKVVYVFKIIEEIKIIPAEYLKKLNKEIYEIRVQQGNDIYRFLCFFHNGKLVVVTHGFQKKTQKTPAKEIKKAEGLRKEYLATHGG